MERMSNIDTMRAWFKGIVTRADCHAHKVDKVIWYLPGLINYYSDPNFDVNIRTSDGKPANMFWIYVNGNRYNITYNHHTGDIDIVERVQGGKVRASVNNSTTIEDLRNIFSQL